MPHLVSYAELGMLRNTFIWTLGSIVLLSLLVACDGSTSVRGVVSDANGRAISGAFVRLIALKTGKTLEVQSSPDGSFSMGMVHGVFAGNFVLEASKPGYFSFCRDLKTNSRQSINVLLEQTKPIGPKMANDWEEIRSIPDEYGGIKHLVVIPEAKQRDRDYYQAIGDTLCKPNSQCSVNFWTDRNHIPQSAWMAVPDLAVMTSSYESSPKYSEAELHLACWLYPNRQIGESMKCTYEPGAEGPPER